jgi:hypothetical protein
MGLHGKFGRKVIFRHDGPLWDIKWGLNRDVVKFFLFAPIRTAEGKMEAEKRRRCPKKKKKNFFFFFFYGFSFFFFCRPNHDYACFMPWEWSISLSCQPGHCASFWMGCDEVWDV